MSGRSMLEDVAQVKAEAAAAAGGNPVVEETDLPEGSAPVEAKAEEVVPEVVAAAEPEEEIRLLGKTFKNKKEAWAYAEQSEAEKLANEAYHQGVRDSLQATAAPAAPVVEENFEEEFYKDPKATLAKTQQRARDEAVAIMRAEQNKENQWIKFSNKYPDIDRVDAERILNENLETLGKVTDLDKGMEILATKTRTYYQHIADKFKPRSELPKTKAQSTAASTGSPNGVTPKTENKKPLSFSEELKTMRKRA